MSRSTPSGSDRFTRELLAELVLGNTEFVPMPTRVNAHVDVDWLPNNLKARVQWMIARLNLYEVATNDTYLLDYCDDAFFRWTHQQIGRRAPIGSTVLSTEDEPYRATQELEASLDRAEAIFSRGLENVRLLRRKLAEDRPQSYGANRSLHLPVAGTADQAVELAMTTDPGRVNAAQPEQGKVGAASGGTTEAVGSSTTVALLRTAFAAEIKDVGFHPFILARVPGNVFVTCKTQNEAEDFTAALTSLPWLKSSKLASAVERALSRQTVEAANLFQQWAQGTDDDFKEAVLVLKPDDVLVHARYNYPVYAFGCEVGHQDAKQRTQTLREAFDAYVATEGNDAFRHTMIEALGLALSSTLRTDQQHDETSAVVDIAQSNPTSGLTGSLQTQERPTGSGQLVGHGEAFGSDENASASTDFIYIAAMMKSGSTLMWLMASALQEPSGRAAPEKMVGVPANEYLPLNKGTLGWFPRGGAYKNHASISYHTDRFQKETGSKSIILLRHPADHLAGFYCHQRGLLPLLRGKDRSVPRSRWNPWWIAVGPIRADRFEIDVPIHQALEHLISDGYLFKMLEWIAEWVLFRHEDLSIIMTYEELMNDYDQAVGRLCHFIRGGPPTADVLNYLRHVKESVASEGTEKGKQDKYLFGWTGSIGTWRQYLSFENACRYNEVVGEFLACHPFASGLLAVYPSPFVDASTVQAPNPSSR